MTETGIGIEANAASEGDHVLPTTALLDANTTTPTLKVEITGRVKEKIDMILGETTTATGIETEGTEETEEIEVRDNGATMIGHLAETAICSMTEEVEAQEEAEVAIGETAVDEKTATNSQPRLEVKKPTILLPRKESLLPISQTLYLSRTAREG